jgi:IPT/TIG domain-containing protein
LRVAKVFTTGITAAALALSMLASAIPAQAAAPGFHAAFFAQSAYPTLARGETKQLSAVYTNNGDQAWVNGSVSSESRLATDAPNDNTTYFDRGWSVNWLSPNRYARNDVAIVAPGAQGSWTFTIKIPANEPAATNRLFGHEIIENRAPGPFNASQSASYLEMEDYGFFLDVSVTVGAPNPAAVLTSLDPDTGSTAGGDSVTITGTGIACTPTNPTVNFGTSTATITSCGSTQVVVDSPAHAAGDVNVTVTNSGAAASNALTFTYEDTTAPTYNSLAVSGSTATLNFSEPVCTAGGTLVPSVPAGADNDIIVRINGAEQLVLAADITFADCDADETDSTATIENLDTTPGDTVAVTITAAGADKVQDADGNAMANAQTRSATAEADVTAPTVESAEATADDEVTLTLSEPIGDCNADADEWVYNPDAAGDVSVNSDDYTCNIGDDTIVITFPADTFSSGDPAGDLEANLESGDVEDESGNSLADVDVPISPQAGPTIDDAFVTDVGVADRASTDDEITLVFNEDMDAPDPGDQLLVQDSDVGSDTIATISCAAAAVPDNNVLEAACAINLALDTITLTLLEDSTDANEVEQTGATAGLQWGLGTRITDTGGFTSATTGLEVDLANSDDIVLDEE